MDRLLVAVDGSKHSSKVVDFAVQIAGAIHADLLMVNVVPDSPVPEGFAEYAKTEGIVPGTYHEQASRGILAAMSARLPEGLKCETIAGIGNAADFILKTAESKSATMMVLGVFGLHSVARVRSLGSVSRRVVENSRIPVVLVP